MMYKILKSRNISLLLFLIVSLTLSNLRRLKCWDTKSEVATQCDIRKGTNMLLKPGKRHHIPKPLVSLLLISFYLLLLLHFKLRTEEIMWPFVLSNVMQSFFFFNTFFFFGGMFRTGDRFWKVLRPFPCCQYVQYLWPLSSFTSFFHPQL